MQKFTQQQQDQLQGSVTEFVLETLPKYVFTDLSPIFLIDIKFRNGHRYFDNNVFQGMKKDLERAFLTIGLRMANAYVAYQEVDDIPEIEVLRSLYNNYVEELYEFSIHEVGMAMFEEMAEEIIGYILLELPYTYARVVTNKEFVEDYEIPNWDDYMQFTGEWLGEDVSDAAVFYLNSEEFDKLEDYLTEEFMGNIDNLDVESDFGEDEEEG